MLIKQNGHITNKDGKDEFYRIWMGQDWTRKNEIVNALHKHPHFFDGCDSQEIMDLFGQSDNYNRYVAQKVKEKTDECCWIEFEYREDRVYIMLFPCS